jgi:hypothetical protein
MFVVLFVTLALFHHIIHQSAIIQELSTITISFFDNLYLLLSSAINFSQSLAYLIFIVQTILSASKQCVGCQ